MPLCHKELRRWFLKYNTAYFNDRLPQDTDVYYVPRDDCLAEASSKDGERVIEVDTKYAYPRLARWALLHEMNHHDTGDWTHGRKFQAGMLRLAIAGAFRNLW